MKRLPRPRRLHMAGAVLAVLFTAVWLGGLSLAPGPAPVLLIVVGVLAPAAMMFAAVLVIDAATPAADRQLEDEQRTNRAAVAARKRAEITR